MTADQGALLDRAWGMSSRVAVQERTNRRRARAHSHLTTRALFTILQFRSSQVISNGERAGDGTDPSMNIP